MDQTRSVWAARVKGDSRNDGTERSLRRARNRILAPNRIALRSCRTSPIAVDGRTRTASEVAAQVPVSEGWWNGRSCR